MNISIKTTLCIWYQTSKIEPKPLDNRHDILGLEIRYTAFRWRSDPLYDIKGFAAHGTRGIWSCTRLFPPIYTFCMKFMTTSQFTCSILTPHTCKAHGTLWTSMLPAPFVFASNFLLTWGS